MHSSCSSLETATSVETRAAEEAAEEACEVGGWQVRAVLRGNWRQSEDERLIR